jgi:Protein of unknown function (DUF2950)
MTAQGSVQIRELRLPLAVLLILAGLSTSGPVAAQAISGQKTFSSPLGAVKSLMDAARSGDPTQLVPIIGPHAADLISSGDLGAAKEVLANFVKAYDQKHSLSSEAQGFEFLQVGTGDWPFPFPIVRDGEVWYFDIDRGNEEILDRRVGRNELGAIAVCEGYVQGQKDYASKGHDGNPRGIYAQQFNSDPGKQNGLYWPTSKGEPESPMGPLVASAAIEKSAQQSAGAPTPYYGYFYRILTAQGLDAPGGAKSYVVDGKLVGGFALIAYPAKYAANGVMTFIVNQDGVVYQQDLGEQTTDAASKITAYNPDSSWHPAQD